MTFNKGPFKVYMTHFFIICLIESTWVTDVNIEKTNPNLLSATVFLLSKNVNFHFRLGSNPLKVKLND